MRNFIIYTLTSMSMFNILFSTFRIIIRIKKYFQSTKKKGIVVALKKELNTDVGGRSKKTKSRYVYYPVIEYLNSKGENEIYESPLGSNNPPKIGDIITIKESKSGDIYSSFWEILGVDFILVILNLAFLGLFLSPFLILAIKAQMNIK